jgi:hypothetical protein
MSRVMIVYDDPPGSVDLSPEQINKLINWWEEFGEKPDKYIITTINLPYHLDCNVMNLVESWEKNRNADRR